jgi:hypothetical protein
MKAMRTFAALLALAFSLAGCGAVDGAPVRPAPGSAGRGSSTAASGADSAEPEQLAAMRQLAGENGDLAVVLYLGSVPERTADVDAALDSLQEQPWQFVADIPADHWVTAPGGGRELYCIFAVRREDTLFVYEKQALQYPHQTGRELYCKQDGQPILLLCNGSPDTPDITAVVYCTTGRTLDWSPRLSAGTSSPEPVEGVDDFSNHPASGAAS